jgi:hypothetical protein
MKTKSILLFTLAILAITANVKAQNIPNYIPTNGLVGWWPFNGNANDESGNGNDGIVNGATLDEDRNGNSNSAYEFNGISSKINFISPINFNNSSFTISLFCRAFNFGGSQIDGYSYVFGSPLTQGTGDQGFRFGTNSTLNTFTATIGDFANNDYFIQGEPGLVDSSWYHLLMTLDKTNMEFSFFINQVLINTIEISNNFGNTDSGFSPTLGAFQLDNWIMHYFNGQIDDIAIWNRALTQEEITALYTASNNNNETSTANVPGAISYQAVARDAQGMPLVDTNLQVQFTLIADSLSGTAEYVETHTLSTNSLGLFTTAFGAGTPVSNTFGNINWTEGNKFVNVQIDAGNGWMDMGTQQLLSTPYSMHSATSGAIKNSGLPVFADNAAAIAGGLVAGDMYRTASGDLKIVY